MHDHVLAGRNPAPRTAQYPELLSLVEAAEILNMSPTSVESAARAGEIPAKQLGGTWRILRAWLSTAVALEGEVS